MRIVTLGRLAYWLVAGGAAATAVLAADSAPVAPATTLDILGNDSYLRTYLVFKTPVVMTAGGKVEVALDPNVPKDPKPIEDFQSPLPPADWFKPDFDDSLWIRDRAPVEMGPGGATGRSPAARHTATVNSMICLRAKFLVEDPAKVHDLQLSLEYVGGVAVYVNGQELTRGQMPAGAIAADTLADKYPDDLYCEPEGMFLQDIKKNAAGFERRYRRLAGVPIPGSLLRKGANVLAVEIHRAPVNAAAIDAKRVPVGGMYVVPGLWAYAGLRSLSLHAAPGSALTPNVARPRGIQVWNCLPFDTVQAFDYGDPAEPLRPVSVPAARNGVFSGRVVVSSDQPIKGLKASVGDLAPAGGSSRAGAGTIPAAAVRVRYAGPAEPGKSWAPPYRFDGLVDGMPADAAVAKAAAPGGDYLGQPVSRKGLIPGAVVPVWVTIRVPKDAEPGTYEGTLGLSADGLAATAVPLRVNVCDWTLRDPRDQRLHNLGFTSPESLARHYGLPLWSDKHLDMMGQSLALMAEVNSRQVVVELAIGFQGIGSNEESMIRWIRKPDGSFDHDFTILDKYLDVIAKSIGKPLPLRFNCWGEVKDGKWTNVKTVSLLDRATGKLDVLEQPPPGTPESLAFWKPVFDAVRKRVEARGWFDVTSVGHNSYCYEPSPLTVSVYRQLWPDGVWSYTAHNGKLGGAFAAVEKGVSVPIRYSECVWTEGRLTARGYRDIVKPRAAIWCDVARNRHRDYSPLTVLADLPEEMIMRGHDGLGQLGVDIFPIAKGGRFYNLTVGRGGLGPDCSTLAILAAGAGGPIPTERYEAFREAVQRTEAILFLQRALEEKRMPEELAQRVNLYLDDRAQAFLRRWSAGRFERDERLLALASEAAAAGSR
jgi:hypothetical protein